MAAKRLTGIGECMIELASAGDDLMRKGFAGDVVNTLWYARKALPANWSAAFYSGIGTDPQSHEMRRFLSNANIDTTDLLEVPDRVPGLYMIHLDGAERSFSYWRDASAARKLASDRDRLKAVIANTGALYISGITLAILPQDDADFLIEELTNARAQGKTVAFDPNIRPRLWSDKTAMQHTIAQAAKAASLILPSFDDEAAAFGDPTPKATLERYGGDDALVVVKNGAESVLAGQGGTHVERPTAPVANPVDTTGAGDSFNGAFLARYLTTQDIDASILAGQTCAADVICHYGAII